jgi:hypothetical protein
MLAFSVMTMHIDSGMATTLVEVPATLALVDGTTMFVIAVMSRNATLLNEVPVCMYVARLVDQALESEPNSVLASAVVGDTGVLFQPCRKP